MLLPIHPILSELAAIFTQQGKQVFLVGGATRDLLRGYEANDWDLATNAHPEEVMRYFSRVIPTGIKHGTVTIYFKGHALEVTTFRTESEYTDGRRPSTVQYAATIEEDLSRRDFTMNAIALELPSGRQVDPFGGAEDIKLGRIRCVGKAEERFAEDGLRPLRAVRFASQLGFTIDESTLLAIPLALNTTAKVAPERIRDEFDKILLSGKPSAALRLMELTGLLALLIPDLAACRGVEQKGHHRFDVLDHSLLACDYSALHNHPQEVRLAALLHDIGKPLVRKKDADGAWSFHNHEQKSAALARQLMHQYRYPNAIAESVIHLIETHMVNYDETWKDGAVRRFIIRVGENLLPNLYRLRLADFYAKRAEEPPPDFLTPLITHIERVLAISDTLTVKDLAVNGRDLGEYGIKPGKSMGIILRELLETVLDDPSQNTRERLLEIAETLQERADLM